MVTVDGLLQRLQALDHRHQFHAVVGGGVLAAGQFLFVRAAAQDRGPAARAGIAGTGAIGEDFNRRSQAIFAGAGSPCRWKRSFLAYSRGSLGRTRALGSGLSQS